MSKLGTVLAFLAGAAVGGGSVWYVLKARYEEISEQDICSAKQAFRAREEKLQREIDNLKERLESPDMDTEEPKTIQASAAKNREKGDINDYAKMVNRVQYSRTSVPQPPEHEVEAPYVSQGSSPFLLRIVDRAALAEDEPSGHSLVHFGPGPAPEPPAAMEQL